MYPTSDVFLETKEKKKKYQDAVLQKSQLVWETIWRVTYI